ncbi:MAG: hypothetical protein CML13_06880 [Puniceicoccaceae bacterium]|nr:hypothetical protein [Puniceicoccaceae bacterium]|tara:strand:+ start:5835 stop:6416 length:582 start_codon:yes stop_codon:yes gene_type:complete
MGKATSFDSNKAEDLEQLVENISRGALVEFFPKDEFEISEVKKYSPGSTRHEQTVIANNVHLPQNEGTSWERCKYSRLGFSLVGSVMSIFYEHNLSYTLNGKQELNAAPTFWIQIAMNRFSPFRRHNIKRMGECKYIPMIYMDVHSLDGYRVIDNQSLPRPVEYGPEKRERFMDIHSYEFRDQLKEKIWEKYA